MKLFPCFLLSCAIITPAYSESFEADYRIGLNNYYGYTDYSKPYNKFRKQNNLNASLNLSGYVSYNFDNDYTASLIGHFMADSAKEVENYNQGVWGEEVFSLFETPMGDFSLGQNKNVAYEFAVGAPNVGAYRTNNSDIVNFITNPNWYEKGSKMSYKTLNSTYINTDGSSAKISYITPEFSGIKLGATYVPETYSRSGLVSKAADYKNKSAYILGAYGSWDLWGYDIETSLGFADYDKNDNEYSGGISIYRKGWTFGASYRKTEVSKNDYALDKANLYDAYREGRAYNVGLSYEFGPITSGLSYFDSKADNSTNHDKIISFSNSFQYNKYVTLSATVAHLRSEGENAKAENNSKGYAFVLGVELSL